MARIIFYLLIISFLSSCKALGPLSLPNTPEKSYFNLSAIEDRYIDLNQFDSDTIKFTGRYKGDRLVFKNADYIVLEFDGVIKTEKTEDAIAFLGPVTNVSILGRLKVNNALTFWGRLERVEISGLVSRGAHTGIRFTQPYDHAFVSIHDNIISNTLFEGIYAGPSYKAADTVRQVRIYNNKISRTGWDAIQVGNCQDCLIESNLVINAATKDERNQNWAITVNPGSRVYLKGNTLIGCKQRFQCLDSRCFWF